MTRRWDGFSEEDITKMKLRSDKPDIIHHKLKEVDLSRNGRKKTSQETTRKGSLFQTNAKNSPTQISSVPETDLQPRLDGMKISEVCVPDKVLETSETSECSPGNTESAGELHEHQNKSLTVKLVMPSLSQPPPSCINLSDFNTKQRLMEEQNRARKNFLAKALEDRKKQTYAEQLRLNTIQEELQKLDQRLSCDVSIIRNQIEAASVEFMEAQKRYDKAEKEFLEAKLHLYTKLERKELLTHHLCTIIEQNEMRKAQKLSELMEKLQMADSEASQPQEAGLESQHDASNPETKRKASSEIILTPTSVVPQVETSRSDCSNVVMSS